MANQVTPAQLAALEQQAVDAILKDYADTLQKGKQTLPEQTRALITADSNSDGKIDGAEHAANIQKLYTKKTLENLQKLDCKKPAQDMLAASEAQNLTNDLNRTLKMLHAKQPGMGAKEYAAGAVKELSQILGAMADSSDQPVMTMSMPNETKLTQGLTKLITEADNDTLAAYGALAKNSQLGRLPSQALPMSATQLCKAIKK